MEAMELWRIQDGKMSSYVNPASAAGPCDVNSRWTLNLIDSSRKCVLKYSLDDSGESTRKTGRYGVVRAAEAALEAQNYVRPIDVLLGIGWLDPGAEKRWRQGQIDYLERAVVANLNKISEAMKQLRQWAKAKGLLPRESHYVSQTRDQADGALQYQRKPIDRTGV